MDGAGPDVRDAVIKVGSMTLAGDVEFHQDSIGWKQHDHHLKPSYNRVILHVVLRDSRSLHSTITESGRAVPLLVLSFFLAEPIERLWKSFLRNEQTPFRLACFGKTGGISQEVIQHWLRRVDNERLEMRILRLRERLYELAIESSRLLAEPRKNYGEPKVEGFPEEIPPPYPELTQSALADRYLWEQVLYEGIMEGLGYSRNRIPFVRLARAVPLSLVRSFSLQNDPAKLAALLFGVSGLLPPRTSLEEPASRTYVRSLGRGWKEFHRNPAITPMHPAEWQFSPSRPHNFPTLRISAAVGVIRNILMQELFRHMIQCVKHTAPPKQRIAELKELLGVMPYEFWNHHYHFDRPAKRPIGSLGTSRINDILANTIFPLSLLYARVFRDIQVRHGAHALREAFPRLSENNSTRTIKRELLGKTGNLASLPLQQGAIQLHRYYCTKGRCGECQIGRRVFPGTSGRPQQNEGKTQQ